MRANFAVAYAFQIDDPGRIENVMDIVAVQRTDSRYIVRDGSSFAPANRGLWPGRWQTYSYSMACGPAKQQLLAPGYSERAQRVGGPGDAAQDRERAFDPNAPMATGGTC